MLSRGSRFATSCTRQQLWSQTRASLRNQRSRYSTSTESATNGTNSALIGGIAGGAVTFAAGYTWYHFSGAKKLIQTANQTQEYYNQAKKTVAQKTPDPDEAFGWLRDTAKSYASWIPGAKPYVDRAFDDLEEIKRKHGKEFDDIVGNAYKELREATKKGSLDMNTAVKIRDILQEHFKRLYELAGDSAGDILDNHPDIKKKVGGSLDQLKEMGNAYGPQAKEEVDRTWQQVKDIVSSGVNSKTVEKIQRLAQEKREKLQKFGDEAWQRGMEEVKPYLERNPKAKELVEKNSDALKKGNFGELWGIIKESSSSGNLGDLEGYINKTVDQAKNSGFNLDSLAEKLPGGSNILSQLQSLQSIAEKKGQEAEKILKDTINDIQGVLSERKKQAEDLADEAKKESK
ncbi:uncharacterized protein CDV56_103101 [Aspergillus thermomutatus]|uniref:Uncharacterized protein n=1 Tax=Aspergillus thermomutatus TaxID=41047 RepID=A0A397G9S7_ASPTH|nr:uncharacterized protein CDV56_103101 [Aspergillus thermomutatus]RHZ44850.1 hypothetical protein CDV56_103101 [Aspergillus thermomutatus]